MGWGGGGGDSTTFRSGCSVQRLEREAKNIVKCGSKTPKFFENKES